MPINTKKVVGRRKVRYESFDEFVADAQRLSAVPVRTLGNWSQGQIYDHLASSLDGSIDGTGFSLPAPVRWMMSLLMKRRMLEKGIPAGFSAPDRFQPGDTSVEEGLAALRQAVARQKEESQRAPHPAFGDIGREGWDRFNLRHAEMHMSFLVNGEAV